ncbi:MAG: RNA degradosome polyphosphate kinase [Intestinibacter sp.]|uniref:RNA degradosome polyphosphate kinase n=1 Tax=Intestinibacter sp. TaxID=1965304 RepID=UPI003F17FDB5
MNKMYDYPQNFFNRELSWLEFNKRVLDEARNEENPLLERVKFLSIFNSNLDEFFMVRVASLLRNHKNNIDSVDIAGMNPNQQLEKIIEKVRFLIEEQYSCYNELTRLLSLKHIKIHKYKNLCEKSKKYIDDYYEREIYPVLTPMIIDSARPFPLLLNKTLNIAALLKTSNSNAHIFGTIQVPSVINRLIEIPNDENRVDFVLLEDVIKSNLPKLFSSHEVLYSCSYRITKDADLDVDEEDAMDLLETMEESLKQRKWGDAVRLEIESNGNDEYFNEILDIIVDEIEIDEQYIFKINGIIDFTFLNKLGSVEGFDELKYEKVKMANIKIPHRTDIFGYIKEKDIFVHHPYESFDIIVDMVKKAAEDPNVLAIKQTLYRVSGNSPIIEALTKAAEKGKQVTVLVELKARFDEENNITWAKKLEKAGCHVIYGVIGLKTHCKILLVVRKEKDKIKRYVHFGTGNYNDVTAKFYTDMGILTADEQFGKDASTLFNMLSGYASPDNMKKITIAPYGFRDKFEKMIRREAENAKKGKKAKIIAKMNSLLDKSITTELYAASQAGVEIELIVRGICCLKPGIKGLSENIKVRSIVGRYLEHSRIYYFYNDGKEELYISSGDWMYRNLNKRVETMGIVEDKDIQQEIKEILDLYLKDNVKAKVLKSDGSYEKKQPAENEKRINAQEELVEFTYNKNKSLEKEFSQTLIIPVGK